MNIMPFGQHKNKTFAEIERIDPGYLNRIASKLSARSKLRQDIERRHATGEVWKEMIREVKEEKKVGEQVDLFDINMKI